MPRNGRWRNVYYGESEEEIEWAAKELAENSREPYAIPLTPWELKVVITALNHVDEGGYSAGYLLGTGFVFMAYGDVACAKEALETYAREVKPCKSTETAKALADRYGDYIARIGRFPA